MPYQWDDTQAGPNTELPPHQKRALDSFDDTVTQEANEGHYAASASLVDYKDPAFIESMTAVTGAFLYDRFQKEVRKVARPLLIRPVSDVLRRGPGMLLGLTIGSTTSTLTAPGSIVLHDGIDANAPIVGFVTMPGIAGQTSSNFPNDVRFKYGLYAQVLNPFDIGIAFIEDTLAL